MHTTHKVPSNRVQRVCFVRCELHRVASVLDFNQVPGVLQWALFMFAVNKHVSCIHKCNDSAVWCFGVFIHTCMLGIAQQVVHTQVHPAEAIAMLLLCISVLLHAMCSKTLLIP